MVSKHAKPAGCYIYILYIYYIYIYNTYIIYIYIYYIILYIYILYVYIYMLYPHKMADSNILTSLFFLVKSHPSDKLIDKSMINN